ncbi:hypothetical protein O181_077198 [Austropuccinia psidii MF-1]|uniref:Retrovirus-related Pol polyprotein from transposon TNT 1-94-like beta-barrel domain-containing protein n=1 Tax=Austropuccinia psidii MF-1 TaxID=1389203 RepID=A0A9Q3FCB5_9BASI|nr:hypothetical protein [Austropuccinia psidii MF-1]
MQQESSNHLRLRTPTPSYKLLRSNLVRDLTTRSLDETLDKTNIDPLTSNNYAKWSNKVKMALTIKNIDIFLKADWISSLPNDAPEAEVEFFQNSCWKIYFWLGNTLDQENYDKFFDDDQENYNPATLWLNICNFYAASSVGNCATVVTKLFGMKIEDGIVSNSIIEIWHQSKLLKSMGQDLFEEKTMSYIELALARNQELSIPDGQALCIGERRVKCKNGKHSPEAPHSEDQCFQLHPHLLKEFKERRNRSKVTVNTTESTGQKPISSPRVFCIGAGSKTISFIKEEHAILDSGASHLLFKDSERFVSFTKTRVALNQADCTIIYAEGFGTTAITGYKGSIIHLKNSLIFPNITTPLISLSPFFGKVASSLEKGKVSRFLMTTLKLYLKESL